MRKSIIALLLIAFTAPSHAATAWKAGQFKDDDGNTVCVYEYKQGNIYWPSDFVDYCPLTIDVDE